ncbi:unnamed protein product, partial [Meganyctiphanes norvegica]
MDNATCHPLTLNDIDDLIDSYMILLMNLFLIIQCLMNLYPILVVQVHLQMLSVTSHIKQNIGLFVYKSLFLFLKLEWAAFLSEKRLPKPISDVSLFQGKVSPSTSEIRQTSSSSYQDDCECITHTLAGVKGQTFLTVGHEHQEVENAKKKSRSDYSHHILNLFQKLTLQYSIYLLYIFGCHSIWLILFYFFSLQRASQGQPKIEDSFGIFIDVTLTHSSMSFVIYRDNTAAIGVVEKFLKLLELIVSEPGQSFKRFVPNTITLCMDHIYPVVSERSSPEVKGPLFELLRCLLEHNWKFFFRSSVHQSLGAANMDYVENEAQFIQIMQALGQSFMQPDISIFKHNLETMESLNSKYKLYHRAVFRNSMLGQFITVLLQVLVHRSQDILQEEITITIYNMASVEFETFFAAFVVHFLQNMEGLSNDQRSTLKENFKTDTDLPTFTQNVQRFINDLRYYRMCNASLPAGTVKL